MKFQLRKGNAEKQKLKQHNLHKDNAPRASLKTPFAKFTKKGEVSSNQASGTFIKKSKGSIINKKDDESLVQDAFLKKKKSKSLHPHSPRNQQKVIPRAETPQCSVKISHQAHAEVVHENLMGKGQSKQNKKMKQKLSSVSKGKELLSNRQQAGYTGSKEFQTDVHNCSDRDNWGKVKCAEKSFVLEARDDNQECKKSNKKLKKWRNIKSSISHDLYKGEGFEDAGVDISSHEKVDLKEPSKKKSNKRKFLSSESSEKTLFNLYEPVKKDGDNKDESETPVSTRLLKQKKRKRNSESFSLDEHVKESIGKYKKSKKMLDQQSNKKDVSQESSVFYKRSERSQGLKGDGSKAKCQNEGNKKKVQSFSFFRHHGVMGESLSGKEEMEEEALEENPLEFIKFSNKKLRGFDGREDKPERRARTIFVGNLPLTINKKVLQALFRSFGKIESVRLRSAVPDKSSVPKKVAMITKKFHKESDSINGYVVFAKLEDAQRALTLNKSVVEGHHIRVDLLVNSDRNYDSGHSVFVGNLPFNITDESLWRTFGECGGIEAVRVVRDSATGVGKGFGFVLFEEISSVKNALSLNGTELNGREMRIKLVQKGKKVKSGTSGREQWDKPVKKSGRPSWRPAGQKKTKKKLIKKKKDMQKKKVIASMLSIK